MQNERPTLPNTLPNAGTSSLGGRVRDSTPKAPHPGAPAATTWLLTPAVRQGVLVLHIVMSIGWMGVDIALFILLMGARTTSDMTLVISGFNAIGMIVPQAVPPLSLGILVTGLILGLGTRWGLIRFWWVLVKLILSLVMTVLVYTRLLPAIASLPILTTNTLSADTVRASLGPLPTMLMFPPVVSFLMLGLATTLSVVKPWGRTPWGRENPASRVRAG
jgi:hypothetical protein